MTEQTRQRIAELVAEAPPLGPVQADRIKALLSLVVNARPDLPVGIRLRQVR